MAKSMNTSAGFVHLDLTGDTELLALLNALPDKLYKRVLKGAVRRSISPVSRAAKSNLRKQEFVGGKGGKHGTRETIAYRERTGLLRESIGTKVWIKPSRGILSAMVGARTGYKREGENPAVIAHLVEFGTKPHRIGRGFFKRAIQHPGAQPKPFMRPAWDARKKTVETKFAGEVRKGIAKEAAKLARVKG